MTTAARVAVVAWLWSAITLAFVDNDALSSRVAASLFDSELAALDAAAGMRDAGGGVRVDPVGVRVDVEGPAWVRVAALGAVAEDPAYVIGEGPHRLIGEFAVDGHAAAARWSLERRGWAVRAPNPTTRRMLPALAWLPLLFAVLAFRRWQRPAAAAIGVGVAAQAASFSWPWPTGLPIPTAGDELRASPLLGPILRLATSLDDRGVAIAGGVIALCVVLAWFDHRRSRERPVPWARVAVVVGSLAWCEAAARVSCIAWLTTGWGFTSAAALAVYFVATRPRRAVPIERTAT